MRQQFFLRAALVVIGLAAVFCYWDVASRAQQPGQAGAGPALQQPAADYLGAERCAGCHQAPTQGFISRGATEYVLLTESAIWSQQDKHSVAYRKLEEAQAQKMGKLLKIDVTQDQSCLSCHAGWQAGHPRPDDFNLRDGVTCESCHGPSSQWDLPHSRREWRTRPVAEKTALQFVNVRDPLARARQCLSCHIGDAEQGKILTHEMYAAGHPPLPSIEIESFVEQMPRHWRYLDEKGTLPDDEKRQIQELLGQQPGRLHRTKGVLVGGVVALRQTVELLGTQAAKQGDQPTWPEFAQFDCAMCHHELQTPSWRQARADVGRPGRPQLHVWPAALVGAGIAATSATDPAGAAELTKDFHERLDRLRGVVTAQPFGDPSQIGDPSDPQTPSGSLVQYLGTLAERIDRQGCDRAGALAALRHLSDISAERLPDYDSARQIAWAFSAIHQDIKPPLTGDAQIRSILENLSGELKLQLPSTQRREILGELGAWYEVVGKYDPNRFREQMQGLKAVVTAEAQ